MSIRQKTFFTLVVTLLLGMTSQLVNAQSLVYWVEEDGHRNTHYTERSAPKRIRDVLGATEAEALLQRRFAIIQTWRSIAARVECEPLAMCDGQSIPKVGFIANQRRYRDRTAETYHISYHPGHRWYYFPLMTRNEVLVFKVFGSDPSAGTQFTAHTSFSDPLSPVNPMPRESIEIRAFAFF